MVSPPEKVQQSSQPSMAGPLLVTERSICAPLPQLFATVLDVEQAPCAMALPEAARPRARPKGESIESLSNFFMIYLFSLQLARVEHKREVHRHRRTD